MNSIPASVLILCIVKLQEFCYKYGYSDYSLLANLLISACDIDGSMIVACGDHLEEIRNSMPFVELDVTQEKFVYSVFKKLKSGL